ncbi:MAG: PIN domain-containing protein, partial [Terrimicrobiaceae bacterium]
MSAGPSPLLDTHAWIWHVGDQAKLAQAELDALDALDFENRPFVSDISLWELATLTGLKRLTLYRSLERWLSIATQRAAVWILGVSVPVAIELAETTGHFSSGPCRSDNRRNSQGSWAASPDARSQDDRRRTREGMDTRVTPVCPPSTIKGQTSA